MASRLQTVADEIETQSGRLRGISTGDFWDGDAANGFDGAKEDLPPLLDLVATRYQSVSSALSAYAPMLEEAQRMARDALTQAQGAQADIDSANRGIDQMEEHTDSERQRVLSFSQAHPDQPPPRAAPWAGPNYNVLLGDAQAELAAARRLLEDAKTKRDEAGRAAVRAVAAASNDAITDDQSAFAKAKRTIGNAARWADENLPLDELSSILGVIAAVAGVLSLFFPAFAVVALVAGGVKLLLDATLWAADDFSAERGVEVAISAVLLVATVGLGAAARGAHGAVKTADLAARGKTVVDAADDLARAGRAARLARGLDTAGNVVDRAGQLNDVRTLPSTLDDVRTTVDIYTSHPLHFAAGSVVANALVPGSGLLVGTLAAAQAHHDAAPVPGGSIAPIAPGT